ncbi:MAG: glycoside hydrolase family 3 N-terminal domain-containing protein, partial [Nitriliruptoraceae bacterium]
ATIFPHNIGLGAAGDPQLVHDIGVATAVEMLATGIPWNYAPVVAVPQDIRWGRTYEAYGADVEVVTELGTAFLEGLQSVEGPLRVVATPKHFVGDGAAEWDTSTAGDYQIDQGDATISEEELRAIHLPPYEATIAAGLADTTGGLLEEGFSWSFVTAPPRVSWTSPRDGAQYMSPTAVV